MGVTEIIKNLIQKGGKRVWTLVTIGVGVCMVLIAYFLPKEVLYGIIGVSGATVFYDTIFKSFQKLFEKKTSEVKEK